MPHSMYTFPAAEQLAGSGLGFLVGLDLSSSVELESGLGFLVGLDFSSSVESEGQSEGNTHLFLISTMPAGQKQPVKEGTHPHCKKKRAMHTKYGVLRLFYLEHLIWCEVTPNFWCVFYAK